MGLGWHARIAATASWAAHLTLMASGFLSIYGVDQVAHVILFYSIFLPLGDAASLDVQTGRASDAPSPGARLGLRLLQAQLAIIYFTSGLEKLSGEQWSVTGEALFRSVLRPDFIRARPLPLDFAWLASAPLAAQAACWSTLVLEIGYGLFIWPARTRRLWAAATIAMHVGIVMTLGLISFAALMIALNAPLLLRFKSRANAGWPGPSTPDEDRPRSPRGRPHPCSR